MLYIRTAKGHLMCDELIQVLLLTGAGDVVMKKSDPCPKLSDILTERKNNIIKI